MGGDASVLGERANSPLSVLRYTDETWIYPLADKSSPMKREFV